MAQPQNFRSALNGFNREDVVHYIEYLNAKHTAEVNQLTSEAEFLRTKLSQDTAPAEALAAAEAERDAARQEAEALRARLEQAEAERDAALASAGSGQDLEARCKSLESALKEAQEGKAQAESARDEVLGLRFSAQAEQELEAYRRAERTERLARERAEQVCRQTNGALAEATVRVDEAAAKIGEMTDQVSRQLSQLQAAVSGSKQALRDAAAAMYAIRPDSAGE